MARGRPAVVVSVLSATSSCRLRLIPRPSRVTSQSLEVGVDEDSSGRSVSCRLRALRLLVDDNGSSTLSTRRALQGTTADCVY